MSLELVLRARASIARLGEKSRQRWWESAAHGPAGGILLRRLFPRSAAWAATELAMDAAAAEHGRGLPAVPTITLFDLGVSANRAVNELLLRHKAGGEPPIPFLLDLNGNLAEALVAGELTTARQLRTVRERVTGAPERLVHVGDVSHSAERVGPEVIGLLVAGYQFSSVGRLVVPYLRVA